MDEKNSVDLTKIARQALRDHGLEPDFSPAVIKELNSIEKSHISLDFKDLRHFLWCSIDNDDSRDLDQLTYASSNLSSSTSIYIAVADVDSLVPKNSPIDQHAQINTTSIYTPTKVFPMLPEKLSTDLTSLNENEDRPAIVIEIAIDSEGNIGKYEIYQAIVRNYAKLAYNSVGTWLDNKGPIPQKIPKVQGLEENLRLQNTVSQQLKKKRSSLGSLSLQTPESRALVKENEIVEMVPVTANLATEIIENFMIAANEVIATKLVSSKLPSLRRVVRVPKRWDRIVELAAQHGQTLPPQPDSIALDNFLIKMRKENPVAFPDLSLSVVKLLGNGEYVVEGSGQPPLGHFGLALKEYTHSTAPNRRYPDLITQRQIKTLLTGRDPIYNLRELSHLADHCTKQEDAATKVERQTYKSAAALLLSPQIGKTFDGIITGASNKGTWVRIFHPPVEGKVVKSSKLLDVGDRVKVKLIEVDVLKGYIDFIAD